MTAVNRASLPFKVSNVDDSLKVMKMLVYGDNVVGKTVLAGSAADVAQMSPVLVVDIKGNTSTLAAFDFKDNITLTKIEHFNGEEQSFEQVVDFILANAGQFKTLVIDSIQGLQELLVGEVTDSQNKEDADLRVWLKVQGKFKNELRKISDLPINVIATANEKILKCERTGAETIVPALSGKTCKEIIGYFDVVGRMRLVIDQNEKVRRVIYFGGDADSGSYIARDNTMTLKCEKGNYVADPSMLKIHELIKSKHDI